MSDDIAAQLRAILLTNPALMESLRDVFASQTQPVTAPVKPARIRRTRAQIEAGVTLEQVKGNTMPAPVSPPMANPAQSGEALIPALDPNARQSTVTNGAKGLKPWPQYVADQIAWAVANTGPGMIRHAWYLTSKGGRSFIRCYQSGNLPKGGIHIATIIGSPDGVKVQHTPHYAPVCNGAGGYLK